MILPRQGPRRRRGRRALAALAVAAGVAWLARGPLLASLGGALVAEDEPMHADVAVASLADARLTAFEAARLWRDGWVRKVVVFTWWDSKLDRTLREMGIPVLTPGEASVAILERLGVPADAIEVRSEPVNGTGAEIAALASLARERGLRGVVYVTARSHSARARWMLGRALAPATAVAVRSPREDEFDPGGWWRSRDDVRELLAELGRWANVVVLRDAWSAPPSASMRADAR